MSPAVLRERAQLVDQALGGRLHRGHLAVSAIDPVLSSTIATRIRMLPQAEVEPVSKLIFGKPATFMKSVVIVPDPVTTMVEPWPVLAV